MKKLWNWIVDLFFVEVEEEFNPLTHNVKAEEKRYNHKEEDLVIPRFMMKE